MKSLYFSVLLEHYALYRQMIFITGPRQVGKTALSKSLSQTQAFTVYLNWDFEGDRLLILQGTQALLEKKDLLIARDRKPILILDEIHKFKNWREFLKGLYDTYSDNLMIVVTGSSQLDPFRCAGDCLMGRYLLYKIHPLSVSECAREGIRPDCLIAPPFPCDLFWSRGFCSMEAFPTPFSITISVFTPSGLASGTISFFLKRSVL